MELPELYWSNGRQACQDKTATQFWLILLQFFSIVLLAIGDADFNYKHYFSNVLLAIVDKFLLVYVGCNGRDADGGVYQNSKINSAFEENLLNVPDPKPLPGGSTVTPYTIVAGDAFPLKTYIEKPYY